MTGLPQVPAERPLPDRDRRRREFLALIRSEQDAEAQRRPQTTRPAAPTTSSAAPTSSPAPTTGASMTQLNADGTLGGTVRLTRPLSARRPANRGWIAVAAVAASVVAIGGAATTLALRGSSGGVTVTGPGSPSAPHSAPVASGPVLNGVAATQAQSELTACLEAAVSGKLTSGNYFGTPKPADPVTTYRVVIADPHLYRAMEDGLSTWIIGKGASGQLAGCSVPDDAANPNGREALLGPKPGAPLTDRLTVEYSTGGVGTANLDGKGASVYANTLIGRYGGGITRVTLQYPGGKEHNALVSDGIWFDQSRLADPTGTDTVPVVRGYGANGKLVFSYTGSH
ncbi:hypothetical protein GXW82_33590 [Streptacidiphilus sp. 4-A2]|nr:hypothetical protein [Streptacidiphilus sp. 4-A2]